MSCEDMEIFDAMVNAFKYRNYTMTRDKVSRIMNFKDKINNFKMYRTFLWSRHVLK